MRVWSSVRSWPWGDVAQGAGRRLPKVVGTALVAVFLGGLIASVVLHPTKRSIEVLAGLMFVAIALVARPFKALLFTLVLIPYPAYTSVGTTSMLLVFALVGLVVVKAKQENLPSPFCRRDVDLALMGWAIMVLLSFYNQPQEAMREATWSLTGFASALILFYLIVYLVTDTVRLWTLLRVTQYVAISIILLGLFQYAFPDKQLLPAFFSFSRKVAEMEEIRRGTVRVTGTFSGQELFAEYLASCAVVQFFLWRRSRDPFQKTFWVISQLLLVACLFATATRGGLIVLLLAFAYMTVAGSRAVPRGQFLMIGFVGIAVFYLSYAFIEPLVSFMMDRILTIGTKDSSIQSRSVVLPQALEAISRKPLLGHGIAIPVGTFHGDVSKNIHNLYLTLAYTIGIPGLIAFLWFLLRLFQLTWEGMRDLRLPGELRELNLLANTLLLVFLVDEIKIEYTRHVLSMHTAWTFFSIALVAWRLSDRYRRTG